MPNFLFFYCWFSPYICIIVWKKKSFIHCFIWETVTPYWQRGIIPVHHQFSYHSLFLQDLLSILACSQSPPSANPPILPLPFSYHYHCSGRRGLLQRKQISYAALLKFEYIRKPWDVYLKSVKVDHYAT